MKRVFLDIETLPPEDAKRERLTFGVLRRIEHRAPSTEFDDDDPCKDEQFRRFALHGEYGRVLCIGVIVEVDGCETIRGLLGRERGTRRFHLNEARTLRCFWKLLSDFNPTRDLLIGHNILEFDLPFLYKRSIIHGVRPSVRLSFARYRSQPIYDTLREWAQWSWKPAVSLSELAGVLGVELSKLEGINGSDVYERFCAGCDEEIALYCLRDVEVAREVYRRMTFAQGEDQH